MDDLWQRRKVEASTYFEHLLSKMIELDSVFYNAGKEEPKFNNDLYFNDGLRKIDFIFVYKHNNNKKNAKEIVNKFIRYLQNEGVQFEEADSLINPNLLFIKVHVRRPTLIMYSFLMNYEPLFMRTLDAPIRDDRVINLPFMHTELSRQEPLSDVMQRASVSALGARPKDLTTAERIMIAGELLKNTKYGEKVHETGIRHLIRHKYIEAAYPIHDRPSKWSQSGALNDRQLLLRFWANFSQVLKYQPLELIHKYYGPEVAFYFAFIGFYNRMLIPVAILGFFSLIYGFITNDSEKNPFSGGICNSKAIFCPECQDKRICSFRPVAEDCSISRNHYAFDNTFVLIYSIIMCFWATIVTQLWKRRETILRYEWNLLNIEQDTSIRPEYREKAHHKRVNKYTGKYEFYIPQRIHIIRVFISCFCCGIMCTIVAISVIATILMRLALVYWLNMFKYPLLEKNILLVSHVASTSALFVCMILFDSLYKYVARKLTDFETPRTQHQYDKSFLFKLHILSMINAYAYLYYTAFFKGSFRTYPGDLSQYQSLGIFNNDVDVFTGGLLPLSFQLAIFVSGKSFLKMIVELLHVVVLVKFNIRRVKKNLRNIREFHSWELGFLRARMSYYNISINEFKTIILQYGYLIIFPLAFPVGPLIAFIANIVEIRFDAIKISYYSRRCVPIRVPGIGAWNTILSTLSYIGIVTNCFLIAFESNFIYYFRVYYYHQEVDLINATFSVFDVKDYPKESDFYGTTETDYCVYKGFRFPPWHPKKYVRTKEYWEIKSYQLLVVIILEAFVLGFHKLLAYAIPSMPHEIKERIRLRRHHENLAREKRLNDLFKGEHHTRTSIAREQIAVRLQQMGN